MPTILCILAGGASSRFGRSKLTVRIDGHPILTWLAERLSPLADQVWLNLAPQQTDPPGAAGFTRVVRDQLAHQGPLAGMRDCLQAAAPDATVCFVAGDMPLIEQADLTRLIDTLHANANLIAAMSRHAGRVQPLPSVWRAGPGVQLIEQAMALGIRGPSGLADQPMVRCLDLHAEHDLPRWQSINRPEDLDIIRRTANLDLQ